MKEILILVFVLGIVLPAISQEESKYVTVASATRMSVVYIGVENPIDIMVAGVPYEKMKVAVSNGTITANGPYKYIVKANNPGVLTINISAEIDGKTVEAGKHDFRVKRIPDPVAKVANLKGGVISKSLLLSQAGIQADIENFDFDLKYNVVGFTASATVGKFEESKTSKSAMFTPEIKALIEKLAIGDKVYFSDIKVTGPDGETRLLGTIVFEVR